MNNMNLGRQLLSTMAAGDQRIDRGDVSGCEMSWKSVDDYIELLPKLNPQQRQQLADEAKQNHPILFEDISGQCKASGDSWRIERE